jgi:hypothetical protein
MHATPVCLAALHHPPLLLLSPPLTRAPRTAHDSILIISRALSFSAQVQRAVQQACMGNTTGQHVQVCGRVWVVGLDVIRSLETQKPSVGHAHSHNAHTRGQLTRTASTAASGKNEFVFHANWQQLHGIGRAARQRWGLVAGWVHPLPRSPPHQFHFFHHTHSWHHFWQQRTQQLVCGGEDAHPRSHVIELTANLEHILDRHLARGFEEERWGVRFVRCDVASSRKTKSRFFEK